MPIYEYKCDDCGSMTEFLESYNNKSPHICNDCKGTNMHRMMSVFSATNDGKSISNSSGSDFSCNSGSCNIQR
jgi:putative FmdB family regulatory protein